MQSYFYIAQQVLEHIVGIHSEKKCYLAHNFNQAHYLHTMHTSPLRRFFRKLWRWTLGLFTALLLLLGYMYLETRWLKVTRITIESPDIPPAFEGKKLVFVSDVHLGKYISRERVEGLVEKINEEHPYAILMGGDYSYNKAENIYAFFDVFKKAHATVGKFAVMGNHDNFVDGDLTRRLIKETGIRSCDNMAYRLTLNGQSIKIGGVGELDYEIPNLEKTIGNLRKKDFCILLVHQPIFAANLTTDKVDLTLSGHTHGGQVTLFGLYAPILPTQHGLFSKPNTIEQRYRYGLVKEPNHQSYISSGFGLRFPPVRFFCRPEYVVLTLKRKL